nr:hypothetical protein [Tanacetum cinerariifolium]
MGSGIVRPVSCIDHEASQQWISNLASVVVDVHYVGYLVVGSMAVVASVSANKPPKRPNTGTWSRPFQVHCSITKPGIDTLKFNDLYNNLRVFESDIKGSTGSSSSTQNVAFVSSDNTSSTNEVNNAYGVSTSSGHNSQKEGSSSYTDYLIHAEDETNDYALMAFNSSNSSSDTEKLLAEAEKEKEELKTKLENFQSSSKGLSKLLNSQMSAKDKYGLGYGSHIHDGVLSYENEVFASVINNRSSDVADSLVNDRFVKVKGMHAILPPMTENYMPLKSNFGIDESEFTYGPKQSTTSESDAKTSDLDSCDSSSSEETLETVP